MIERSAEEKRDYVTSILTADRIDCRELVKQRQTFLDEAKPKTAPVVPAQFSAQRARQTEAKFSTVHRSMTEAEQEEQGSRRQEQSTRWVLFFVIIPALSLLRYAVTNIDSPEKGRPASTYRRPTIDIEEIRSKIGSPPQFRSTPDLNLAISRDTPVSTSENEGVLSADLPDPDPSDITRFDAIIAVRSDPAAAAALAEINADFLRTQRVLRMKASQGLLPKGWIKHYNARVELYLETVYQLALQHGHGAGKKDASSEAPVPSSEGGDE